MAVNYFDQQTLSNVDAGELAYGELGSLITYGFLQYGKNANGETVFVAPDDRVKQLMYARYGLQLSDDGKTLTRIGNTIFGGPETYNIDNSRGYPVLNATIDNEMHKGTMTAPLLNVADIKDGQSQINYLNNFVKYAQGATARKQYVSDSSGLLGDIGNLVKDLGPLVPVAIAFALPQAGALLAENLFASEIASGAMTKPIANALGSAIISTAVQTGSGVPLDKAIQNSAASAAVSLGAPEFAKTVNDKLNSPAVSNAIASAGGSIVKTLASGGSSADISKNVAGALAGSITASVTGDKTLGAAVGGGVTGGATGAAVGVAGQLGQPTTSTTPTTPVSSVDPGVQVAGGDDASAIKLAIVSAMPEMLGRQGEIAGAISFEDGVYKREITGKTADGKDYSYTATYDPQSPAGKQYYYQQSAGLITTEGDPAAGTTSASSTRPTFDVPVTDSGGGGTQAGDVIIPDTTVKGDVSGAGGGAGQKDATAGKSKGVEAGSGVSDSGITSVNLGQGKTEGSQAGFAGGISGGPSESGLVGSSSGAGTSTKGTGTGGGGGGGGSGAGDAETSYTPELFIYGGKSTTLSPTAARSLGTDLQSAYPLSGTTTGLTAYRPAGEIESQETGKKRQNVWNEESLRLKDALGL